MNSKTAIQQIIIRINEHIDDDDYLLFASDVKQWLFEAMEIEREQIEKAFQEGKYGLGTMPNEYFDNNFSKYI
ncbi:hypothetical protein CMT52_17805 [Elizabethkingia anophelis]|nr:hypothetical protein [Elizabethkingia anophelis]